MKRKIIAQAIAALSLSAIAMGAQAQRTQGHLHLFAGAQQFSARFPVPVQPLDPLIRLIDGYFNEVEPQLFCGSQALIPPPLWRERLLI